MDRFPETPSMNSEKQRMCKITGEANPGLFGLVCTSERLILAPTMPAMIGSHPIRRYGLHFGPYPVLPTLTSSVLRREFSNDGEIR